MGRVLLGILLASVFLLAGCLAPVSPDWGNDLSIERSDDGTFTFTSTMSGETVNSVEYTERGCEDGAFGSDKEGEVKFEGYMSASEIYDSHNPDLSNNIAFATSAAVAINSMSFEDAKNVRSGEGERVEVKDWSDPVAPDTGAGTADLDKIDPDSETKWFVLGLIPVSENINDGIAALGKYHQPIRITGYLVQENSNSGSPIGGMWSGSNDLEASSDCVAKTGNQNIAQIYVLVTKIELADSVVSLDGEHDDEYTFGDVSMLGRTGFILFLLIVGAGGAVGAYMYSSLRLTMSARSVALTLLGKEGVEKAAQVRQRVKDAEESGMKTPDQRRAEQRKQAKPTAAAKPKKSNKDEDDGFGSFSIDSALSGGSDSGSRSEFGSGSSVVASDDAKRVEREVEESEPFVPPTSTFGGGAPASTSSSSTPTPVSSSTTAKKKPKVRRRKAVRKQAEPEPETEPEPQNDEKTFWQEEEDDFSDFNI